MHFTRLRLNGFKSFVDPTEMVIAEGLTGIVGPNGCGKSNLLEAMRWVMGENRPTAMRGAGMEDVIFAGASSRPARNFAEVSLYIDNSERLAPASFNESDLLEITRRITRDAGSAYKVNSKDVRARDVQMLFADASTGAHSPALVRQGMISELINARPQARRRILEEAAGISGLYQRRHEAELKLKGAESNLERVEDVIEQLAGQLAQLARQARQAARYRDIGERLRRAEGILLFLHWKEADEARLHAERAHSLCSKAAGEAERQALAAVAKREKAEAALPPLREEEAIASAVLQRAILERDTLADREQQAKAAVETLGARLEQLERDRQREETLNNDARDMIASLRREQEELSAANTGHEERLEQAAADARKAAADLQVREDELARRNEDLARLHARHQSARRLFEDSKKTLERTRLEAERANLAIAEAERLLAQAEAGREKSQKVEAEAIKAAEQAEIALAQADQERAEAQSRESEARASSSEAEGEASALRAEVAALARLLERDGAEGGQVLDELRVDRGYEQALGAALADDLRAPALEKGDDGSGWVQLPAYANPQPLPEGVPALTNFVSVPPVLARRMSQIGLVDAEQGPRLQSALKPGQRLVSTEGDLWRWDGFRASAQDAPSAAALRMQQLNRFQELRQDLEEATARAEGAAQAHRALKAKLVELTEADRQAREARRSADLAATEASRALSRAEAEVNLQRSKLESLRLAAKRHEEEAAAAARRLEEAEAALAELGDIETAEAAVSEIKTTVEAARLTMLAKRAHHEELRRDGEARRRRLEEIRKELDRWEGRLASADKRVAELASRRIDMAEALEQAKAVPGEIAAKRAEITSRLESLEARRKSAADALAAAEAELRAAVAAERDAERAASSAREERAAAEARAQAALEAVKLASDRISEEQQTSPQALLESLGVEPERLPTASEAEIEVARLRRQREALGAVNLRAEEDAREVQDEHDLLVSEKQDLEEAIRKLRTGIANLNREGRERLLTAFEQVNTNFASLFRHLFGGGEAKLVLVESDDPLEAGLEIMCQPPGKKLSTLSLLSGGEQTLTALALIFAVFLANPAPICVLDEVDAPLDDANVTRFCDMLDEMTRQTATRFIVITHHAVTMSRMDRLFGVTMAEQGVSQLVSVDLKQAEKMVA